MNVFFYIGSGFFGLGGEFSPRRTQFLFEYGTDSKYSTILPPFLALKLVGLSVLVQEVLV